MSLGDKKIEQTRSLDKKPIGLMTKKPALTNMVKCGQQLWPNFCEDINYKHELVASKFHTKVDRCIKIEINYQ